MAITTITINDKKFQIACNDGEEERVKSAGLALNDKIEHMKILSPKASTEFLLTMCALSLQDEITKLRATLSKPQSNSSDNIDEVSETLSTIAGYLETLASKIAKQ